MHFTYNASRKYLLFNALYHLANTKFIQLIAVFKCLFCSLWDFSAKTREKCREVQKKKQFERVHLLVDSAGSHPHNLPDSLSN